MAVFTCIYIGEMMVKMTAIGPKEYFLVRFPGNKNKRNQGLDMRGLEEETRKCGSS